MIDLKGFRKANNMSQKDLAEYLGVSRSFVGQVESNFSKLPQDKLNKLLTNKESWDVSMLLTDDELVEVKGGAGKEEIADLFALRVENQMLKAQVEELKSEKAQYWEMIKKLMEK